MVCYVFYQEKNRMRVLGFILEQSLPYRKYIWGLVFSSLLITFVDTIQPYLVKNLIDTVSGNAHHNIWIICSMYSIVQCIPIVAWSLSDYCNRFLNSDLRMDIAEFFMKNLYGYSYTFFQNQLSGGLNSKINDAAQLIPGLIWTMIQFIRFIVLLSISIGFLWSVQPVFGFSIVVWVFLFLSINFFCTDKIKILVKTYAEEKSKVFGAIADYLINIFSVKTFVTKDFEIENFQKSRRSFVTTLARQNRYFMNFYILQGTGASFYDIGTIVLLLLNYQKGLVTPGDFALVITLNFSVMNRLFELSHMFRNFTTDWGSVDQALEIFAEPPQVQDKPGAKTLLLTQGKICFDKIGFQYKDNSPLFEDVSFSIDPGNKIGLVGYSGGGKTTLVNLLLRLYDVQQGNITIDGQDIREVTQDSLRQQIGLIPQNPSLFHRTIGENIRYGRTDATDIEVQQAAKQAGASGFIEELPQGYDSLVGERGVKLSGGQIQRIAIARVFLKNPPILILDEATSALDSLTESDIQERLWELMQGKTVIVIAHRLSTLLQMDRIIVLKQGNIIQQGAHKDLLNQAGLYKTLWNAQVGGFLPSKRL